MRVFSISRLKDFNTAFYPPSDKSISQRAIILSSICRGKVKIYNLLRSEDTLATLEIFKKLGVKCKEEGDYLLVKGRGKYGLNSTVGVLNCKDSGTTMRLLAGVLVAQKFSSVLRGGSSLSRRPMSRITIPLRMMEADIQGRKDNGEEFPPLKINPVKFLKGIEYKLPIPSAQVKSCLLLAGLYARTPTTVIEEFKSRDHTERFLKLMQANIHIFRNTIKIFPSNLKTPGRIFIPGDFSSSAFFIALCILKKNSYLTIKNVSLNPTRSYFLKVLERMGARIYKKLKEKFPEPFGDIRVCSSELKSTVIEKEEVPLLIDELPVFMVLATQARGKTLIKNCKELKVKETDRIKSMVYNLRKMGACIKVERKNNDYFIEIKGPTPLKGTTLKSFFDHRTCMSLVVATQIAEGNSRIYGIECVNKSFPSFFEAFKKLHL